MTRPGFIDRRDGSGRIYNAAATKGTLSSRQIRAAAERAARTAAKGAEGTKPLRRTLPPRELASEID